MRRRWDRRTRQGKKQPRRPSKLYASTVLASLYDVFDNGRLTREEAELGFVYLLAQSISYQPTRADRDHAAQELQKIIFALANELAVDRHGS
jgi:hypothetical protein